MAFAAPDSSLKLRKLSRHLSYRRRHLAISSNEQVESRAVKRLLWILMVQVEEEEDASEKELLSDMLRILMIKYLVTVVEPVGEELPVQKTRHRLICSFCPSVCKMYFRFRKEHLVELFHMLRFPEWIKLKNRSLQCGEEVFLRGLCELTTGMQQEMLANLIFGGVGSDQSLAFSWFVNHLFKNFKHLLRNNLDWWYRNGFFAISASAISRKANLRDGSETVVSHFIDCNCLPTSVTGGGPAEAGPNAARWDDKVQRAMFNGWKSTHGLKHQTVDNAFGMSIDISCPRSLRQPDPTILTASRIHDRFRDVQVGDPHPTIIFGDSAYHVQECLRSYLWAEEGVADYQDWNGGMKRVRISIEWNYGYTVSLFRYVGQKHKLKVMRRATVMKVYTIATLMRNLHIGFYGGQSSNYFNLVVPPGFNEHYLNSTDF
jgi:hypothetical protein